MSTERKRDSNGDKKSKGKKEESKKEDKEKKNGTGSLLWRSTIYDILVNCYVIYFACRWKERKKRREQKSKSTIKKKESYARDGVYKKLEFIV